MVFPDETLNYYADRFVALGLKAFGLSLEKYLRAPRFHEGRFYLQRIAAGIAGDDDARATIKLADQANWCRLIADQALKLNDSQAAMRALRNIRSICESGRAVMEKAS